MQSETELQVEQELRQITHYCRQMAVANASLQHLNDDQERLLVQLRADNAALIDLARSAFYDHPTEADMSQRALRHAITKEHPGQSWLERYKEFEAASIEAERLKVELAELSSLHEEVVKERDDLQSLISISDKYTPAETHHQWRKAVTQLWELRTECASIKTERDQAVADNAALLNALREYGDHQTGCTHCSCGLDRLLSSDHPGAAILAELDGVRKERDEALDKVRQQRCGKTESRARAWKAAAKQIKADRDDAVVTWASWHDETERLKSQLHDAQQRIAELEAANTPQATWWLVGDGAHDLVRDGAIIARVRRVAPGAWYYEIRSTTSVPSYATAEEAMWAVAAALLGKEPQDASR